MLSDYPSLLTTLKLSTNFFDMGLLTSISRVGSWGTLCHLDFAANGTKLTAEGLKEVIEGCRGLESLTLNDIEGRIIVSRSARLTFRSPREEHLEYY